MTIESTDYAATTSTMLTANPSVLLICVKYSADRETERYLDSIRALHAQSGLHVLLVDNTVEARWSYTSDQSNCRVLRAPRNLGYFGGARYGLSRHLAENPMPDWLIISNVDLSLDDPTFLERLAPLGSIPDVGAVAASIRSALTGIDQNPFMRVRPSVLRMHAYKWLYRSQTALNGYEGLAAFSHRAGSALRKLRPTHSNSARETIYAPHGSFLILSKNYFDRGGDLDFPEFLFGEEIYIAESVRRLGLKVIYEPALRVNHQEHHSTGLFKSKQVAGYVAASAAYCADTFFPF